jgi:serine/threonine protein kinase
MKTCGTVIYCAPEILVGGGKYTVKADIYSIGFIIWEILYKLLNGKYQRPYGEYPDMIRDIQFLKPVCADRLRPTVPSTSPPELARIITSCWAHEINNRPVVSDLLGALGSIEALYKENKTTWDSLVKTI